MNINNYLLNFEKEIRGNIEAARKKLDELPEGELRCYHLTRNGKQYNQYLVFKNGKRKSLNKNSREFNLYLEKKYYEKLLEDCEQLKGGMDILRALPDMDPLSIYETLPTWVQNGYHLPQSTKLLLPSDPQKAQILINWANAKFETKKNQKEGLRHKVSNGMMVRSKSEALIIEKILQLGIAFRYECGIEYEPGKFIFPDVTMMRTDNKLYYLEHCGMMNSREYLDSFKWKINIYESLGIVLWDNLILTFDDKDGNIDMRIIESELRNKVILQ